MDKNLSSYPRSDSGRHPHNRNWTLMFIGEHGKVRSIKGFKGIAIGVGAALLITFCLAVTLFVLVTLLKKENNQMKNEVEVLQKQYRELKDEKDILIAKLVLAESKNKDDSKNDKNVKKNQEKDASETAAVPEKKAEKKPEMTVKITDFNITHDVSGNRMRIQFKLRNAKPTSKPISGRTFVILKQDKERQNTWLAIPTSQLVNGKPFNYKKGQYFSIYRYKTVKFRINHRSYMDNYSTATIYVYSSEGEVIFEEDFDVDIKLINVKKDREENPEISGEADEADTEEAETDDDDDSTGEADEDASDAVSENPSDQKEPGPDNQPAQTSENETTAGTDESDAADTGTERQSTSNPEQEQESNEPADTDDTNE